MWEVNLKALKTNVGASEASGFNLNVVNESDFCMSPTRSVSSRLKRVILILCKLFMEVSIPSFLRNCSLSLKCFERLLAKVVPFQEVLIVETLFYDFPVENFQILVISSRDTTTTDPSFLF